LPVKQKYRPLLRLILISSMIRVLIAALVELGNDEVYYFTYALFPALSHFDHPSMVGWVIQLFSLNQFLQSQFLLRLPSIIFAAANTYFIFHLGHKIKNEQTGFYAAILYTASIYTSLIAGVFIIPDTPQLFFWIGAIYIMVDVLPDKGTSALHQKRFLLLGLLIGLGMISKYTSIFLWGGIFIYLIIYNRHWFKSWSLYVSGFISLLIFSPVLIWNQMYHFISFTFHEERVSFWGSGIRFDFIGTEILGEFLYQNPVVFVLVWMALIAGIRKKSSFMNKDHFRILLMQSLPLIGVFVFFSLFRKTLPHWTGPAYISLILIAAAYLSEKHQKLAPFQWPASLRYAIITIVLVLTLGFAQINYGLIDLKKYLGNDLTLDMYGWRKLKEPFGALKEKRESQQLIQKDAPIISYRWFPAAHIDYYVALPNHTFVLGLGPLERIHKYAWINEARGGFKLGMDAWYLAFDYDYVSPDFLKAYFKESIPTDTITIHRGGQIAKEVYVYMLKDLQKIPPNDFRDFMEKNP